METALARVLPAPEQQPSPSRTTSTLKILLAAFALLVLAVGSHGVPARRVCINRLRESSHRVPATRQPIGGISSDSSFDWRARLWNRIDAAFYREETGQSSV